MMFDYMAAARRVGIPGDKLECLVALARADFPDDEPMAELHILRAILAVERGDASVEEILSTGSRGPHAGRGTAES